MAKTYISEIDGKWYAYEGDERKNQVYSIGRDDPETGVWVSRWTDSGIMYVASASPNRAAAAQKARRHGEYCGVV